MKVRYWGTRGNIAQPSYEVLEFGGNTICTQLFYDDEDDSKYFILDMGTGLIEFGESKPFVNDYHIIISSFFWDHLQGLPFFRHIHRSGVKINVYSSADENVTSRNLDLLFDGTYSPLENISNLKAEMCFHGIPVEEEKDINGAMVSSITISKKKLVSAIKIRCNGKTAVYAGNFEIDPKHPRLNDMVEFIKDADLFICDAQYTQAQYSNDTTSKGHSKIENTINLALQGNVKRLHLYHHNPFNSDNFLKGYLNHLMRFYGDIKTKVEFAKQGEENIVSF